MTPSRLASRRLCTRVFPAIGLAAMLTACSAPPPPSQAAEPSAALPPPTPAIAPALSVNELMVTLIDNASHVLWDVEKKGFEPKDDADWIEVEDHAMQLAAAATLLQLGGTGPSDAVWVQSPNWLRDARLMGEAGRAAHDAAKSRNLAAVVKANGELVATCEGCHKEFKPDAPTEGIAHQTPHSDSHAGN
jgi:hypothetical protein